MSLMQDLSYGLRMLRRSPGFTAAAVLTLALGIGANTSIFTVVDSVLLRALPFHDPESLVLVWESNADLGLPYMFAAPPNVADWIEQSTIFEEMATYTSESFTLTGGDEAERLQGTRVSANMFTLLGSEPSVGRRFLPEEGEPGAPRVALLSWGLWQRRFGGSEKILGQTIEVNGEGHTVVGVMPRDFRFPPRIAIGGKLPSSPTELWLPLTIDYRAGNRQAHYLIALGRLKPGLTLEAARSEMQVISGRLAQEYPDTNQGWTTSLVPLAEQVTGPVRPALLLLLGAVALVLLLACANVANLLLSRGVGRQKEIAIRVSMGASPARLIRLLLGESMLLALLGGVAGLVLAILTVNLLAAMVPPDLPRLEEIGMDWRVLGFTLLLCVVAGMLFGLAPVMQASQLRLHQSLTERSLAGSARVHALRKGLVVIEVLLAVILLVGAGLLIKSLLRMHAIDHGFRPRNVLTFSTSLPRAQYSEPQRRARFVDEVRREIEDLPGVRVAGAINDMPLAGDRDGTSFEIPGEAPPESGQMLLTHFSFVTPGYFRAMGITIVRGRTFSADDRRESRPVIVINEALARHYFPDQDPIGRQLVLGFDTETAREIVGVVGDVRHTALTQATNPNTYAPYLQLPQAFQLNFAIRTDSNPKAITGAVREIIRSQDQTLAVFNVRTMQQIVAASLAQERFSAILLAIFAGLALLLAAVGTYGVISYSVSQQLREMGIRIALGARKPDILLLVISGAMRLVLIGIGIGIVGSLLLTRFLASLLYNVRPTDVPTLVIVAVILAAVALLACYLPARRATRVDPMESLRAE